MDAYSMIALAGRQDAPQEFTAYERRVLLGSAVAGALAFVGVFLMAAWA